MQLNDAGESQQMKGGDHVTSGADMKRDGCRGSPRHIGVLPPPLERTGCGPQEPTRAPTWMDTGSDRTGPPRSPSFLPVIGMKLSTKASRTRFRQYKLLGPRLRQVGQLRGSLVKASTWCCSRPFPVAMAELTRRPARVVWLLTAGSQSGARLKQRAIEWMENCAISSVCLFNRPWRAKGDCTQLGAHILLVGRPDFLSPIHRSPTTWALSCLLSCHG